MRFTVRPDLAGLIDYVTTMHSYDALLEEKLLRDEFLSLRRQVGRILVDNETGIIEIDQAMLDQLLILIPITMRIGSSGDDIGYELKLLLYEALVGKPLKLELWEEKNASTDTDKDIAEDKTTNSTGTP